MGFVFAGFFGLALLIGVVWLIGFLYLNTKERVRRQRQLHEAECDRLLQTAGEPLRCHGCGSVFEGPVSDLGCATCHTTALIVPERQQELIGRTSRKVECRR